MARVPVLKPMLARICDLGILVGNRLEGVSPRAAAVALMSVAMGWIVVSGAIIGPMLLLLPGGLLCIAWRRRERILARSLATARAGEAAFRHTFAALPQPTWVYDEETLFILAANDAACAQYGYSVAEFRRLRVLDMHPPAEVLSWLQAVSPEPGLPVRRWRHRRKDGTFLVVDVASSRIDFGGRPARVVSASDVTDRMRDEQQVGLLKMAFVNVSQAVAVLSATGRLLTVNPAFERVTGYAARDVVGKSAGFLVKRGTKLILETLAAFGRADVEVLCKGRDGVPFAVELSIRAARTAAGTRRHFVAIARASGTEPEDNLRVHELQATVRLASVPDHKLIEQTARRAIALHRRSGESFALLCVCLDNFKAVGDSFGRVAAASLLRTSSQRIESAAGESAVAAWCGGDQFAVLLPGTQAEIACRVAQRIAEALSLPCDVERRLVACGSSTGIALFPEDGADFETLHASAATAMRGAHAGGRNGWQLYATLGGRSPTATVVPIRALH